MEKDIIRVLTRRTKGQRFDTIRTKLVFTRSEDHGECHTVTDLAHGWHGMGVCIRASVEGVRLAGGFERFSAKALFGCRFGHNNIEEHQQTEPKLGDEA